jgi:hypothetical protein
MQESLINPIQIIKKYWAHTGIKPAQILERNQFGNLLVQDGSGRIWRICPEELSCEVIAKSSKEFQDLWNSAEFQQDWQMTGFAVLANRTFGDLDDEMCYYFKKAGDYSLENIGTIAMADLIIGSGIAAQELASA